MSSVDKYYQKLHKQNIKGFLSLYKKIVVDKVLQIMDIRIDREQFGHIRVVIFVRDCSEQ